MRGRIVKYIMVVGIFVPTFIVCQRPNRISLQTGFFQLHFDGTPVMIVPQISHNHKFSLKMIGSDLRSFLFASDGINFTRKIAKNSYIGIGYMVYQPYFPLDVSFTPQLIGPKYISKYLKHININYSRKLDISKEIKFTYGGGINYTWGKESIYLFTVGDPTLYEPVFFNFNRNDFGLNARVGIEYTPLEWLTLFTQFNFVGKIIMNARGYWPGHSNIRASTFFKEYYHRSDIPSRIYLTWRFGIGYNFK